MNKRKRTVLGTASLGAMLAAAALGAGPASAHSEREHGYEQDHHHHHHHQRTVTLRAHLTELNGSGASGTAKVVLRDDLIRRVRVNASGLTPDAPHAMHIHYGEEARNECPSLFDDANDDGLLSTAEGVPAYGPIAVSLTTRDDTTPASGLDVSRFPSSSDGSFSYLRRNLSFTDVAGAGAGGGTASAEDIAEAVRNGAGVVVIHGVDYNGNGTYDGDEPSELDPSLPREATDPAICGVLR
jgi:hypothetical protein